MKRKSELQNLIFEYMELGWRVEDTNKGYKLFSPNYMVNGIMQKGIVIVHRSGGNNLRALSEAKGDLRRIQKMCNENY